MQDTSCLGVLVARWQDGKAHISPQVDLGSKNLPRWAWAHSVQERTLGLPPPTLCPRALPSLERPTLSAGLWLTSTNLSQSVGKRLVAQTNSTYATVTLQCHQSP